MIIMIMTMLINSLDNNGGIPNDSTNKNDNIVSFSTPKF